ncbi:hypothetical protein JYT20_01550, partial [Rhodothermus sp. AH-315-K08]|nr:hypothetical protein [Rhodothermus sp. AH-315-K08]
MKSPSCVFAILVLFTSGPAIAQTIGSPASIRVFLDCQYYCDSQYIIEELPIVDFVTEPTRADVHILYVQQTTGAGGARITLT